jgi:hypothetical protein
LSSSRKSAALGIRAHSGWAAIVTVTGNVGTWEVLDRRKMIVADSELPGAKQPFHFAEPLGLKEAEAHLARCAKTSAGLALHAMREVCDTLAERGYWLKGCALLTASGRTLPDLAGILASHALIHAAEGQFFRDVLRDACRDVQVPVSPIRERDLFTLALAELGIPLADLNRRLLEAGRSIGPPWAQDQKHAALAGWIVLAHS